MKLNMNLTLRCLMSALVLLTASTALSAQATAYKDGIYFAQEANFAASGWKGQLIVRVKAGKIVAVNWNGVNNLNLLDKKTVAQTGGYGMGKVAKKGEWHLQAAAVETWVIKNQGIGGLTVNANKTTDGIAGASVKVDGFVALFNQAISSAPVASGLYKKDGWYRAEEVAFDPRAGWKDSVLLTVVNGRVVDAVWNGAYKDATKKSKLSESISGAYGMEKAAKAGAWHVQAARVEAHFLTVQDPAKVALKDGKVDGLSGASLNQSGFFALASNALKTAR